MEAVQLGMGKEGNRLAPIALTMGEPAGIGGEIALKAWGALQRTGPPFFLVDDPDRVARLSSRIGLAVPVRAIASAQEASTAFGCALPVLPLKRGVGADPGRLDERNAPAVLEAIERAVELVRSADAAAVVTNPIHKSVLYRAGFRFPGHTEYLAALAGIPRSVMMLVSPELRVVPVTVHVPLAGVPALLTAELVTETARIAEAALRCDFGIPEPRLAVAGLNPHAGEGGTIGTEDREVVAPAVSVLQNAGIRAFGPLSPDSMFHRQARERYDAALCMYHDQALIPLKTLAFDRGVNVTLGLPFVRTSPDHGTALDIAGTGMAKPDSLVAAIELAATMARNRAIGRHS